MVIIKDKDSHYPIRRSVDDYPSFINMASTFVVYRIKSEISVFFFLFLSSGFGRYDLVRSKAGLSQLNTESGSVRQKPTEL